MNFVHMIAGEPVLLALGVDYTFDEGTISYESLVNMPLEERSAIGIYSLVDPAGPDFGFAETSRTVGLDANGTPIWNVEYEAVRFELPKSTVIERVIDAGKIDAVQALLLSNAIFFAQWTSPDWPNVFCDDPGLIMALNAVGCTEEEILQITAYP